jgi:two-component system alkaline phosphatase synthesis response regulator PhoP
MKKLKRILLVEDEESLRKMIQLNLEIEGYEVVSTYSGKEGFEYSQSQYFDLIILDIMLPDADGVEICEKIRLSNKTVGIIYISAKNDVTDIVLGLRRGGDDYLVKPFHLEELLVRVDRLVQRTHQASTSEMTEHFVFGENTIYFDRFEAQTKNGIIKLSQKEKQLLKLLIDRKNEVVSRKEILNVVWEYDVMPSTRTIDNFILSFRKYFEADPGNPVYFKSVRGVGYQFKFDY